LRIGDCQLPIGDFLPDVFDGQGGFAQKVTGLIVSALPSNVR
jgi:hypothetical protein